MHVCLLYAGMIESYDKYTYVHKATWGIECTEISHFFPLNSLRIMNQASLQESMLFPLCIFVFNKTVLKLCNKITSSHKLSRNLMHLLSRCERFINEFLKAWSKSFFSQNGLKDCFQNHSTFIPKDFCLHVKSFH